MQPKSSMQFQDHSAEDEFRHAAELSFQHLFRVASMSDASDEEAICDLRVEDQARDTTSNMGKSAMGHRSVWRKFVDNVEMWRRSARGSRQERR